MGYILKKGNGAGVGDATSANQSQQIKQLIQDDSEVSVFKSTNLKSVFLNDGDDSSVFKTVNGDSIFDLSKITNGATKVTYFEEATVAALSTNLTAFLQANPKVIISIVYADRGGIGLPHSMFIIYNDI